MILSFILLGLIAGLLAGLLGIGGGVVTVPALYFLLTYFGFPQEKIMQVSIATALASTILTAIGSTWSHQKKGAVLYDLLRKLFPGLLFGCIGGAILTHLLSSELLRMIFGVMAIFIAVYLFFPHLPLLHLEHKPTFVLNLFGACVGSLSSLLGIGGGVAMVPLLLCYGTPMRQAVGTSSAGTLITALLGTISYLILAWSSPPLPYTFGYIEIPAFMAIGLSSLLTTHIGAHLAYTLPTLLIRRIFACALALTGFAILF